MICSEREMRLYINASFYPRNSSRKSYFWAFIWHLYIWLILLLKILLFSFLLCHEAFKPEIAFSKCRCDVRVPIIGKQCSFLSWNDRCYQTHFVHKFCRCEYTSSSLFSFYFLELFPKIHMHPIINLLSIISVSTFGCLQKRWGILLLSNHKASTHVLLRNDNIFMIEDGGRKFHDHNFSDEIAGSID